MTHARHLGLTSAISMRIPFGLSLYVGGKSENMAKFITSPAAVSPSVVTKNLLFVVWGVDAGRSVRPTCLQLVCLPSMAVTFDARVSPEDVWRPTVRFPTKEDWAEKRK